MHEHDPLADERDGHEMADRSEELATVGRVVRSRRAREGEPMSTFALRMPVEVLDAVATVASERGVPSGTLMRQWIVERLALERQRPSVASDAVWAAAMEALPRLAEDIAARLAGRRSA